MEILTLVRTWCLVGLDSMKAQAREANKIVHCVHAHEYSPGVNSSAN